MMRLTWEDAIKMIDRDNVWAAFGLLKEDGSYVDSHATYDVLRPWTDNYDGKPVATWPAALGGGKTKRPL